MNGSPARGVLSPGADDPAGVTTRGLSRVNVAPLSTLSLACGPSRYVKPEQYCILVPTIPDLAGQQKRVPPSHYRYLTGEAVA